MIKNLKIGEKLILLMAVSVISIAILVGVGLYNIIGLGNDIENTYDSITVPTGYAGEMALSYGDVRESLRNLALSLTTDENAKYLSEYQTADENTKELIKAYEDFLKNSNITEGDEYDLVKRIASNYVASEEPTKKAIGFAEQNKNSLAALIIKEEIQEYAKTIRADIEGLVILNEHQSLENNSVSFRTVYISEIMLVAVGIIALLILVVLSVIIFKSITKPIKFMVDAAENMANGDLSINFNIDSKDETGILAEKFKKVSVTLTGLTDDLAKLSKEHAGGDFDARIDSGKYNGAFNELAVGLNDMLETYVDSIKEVLNCVGGFGEGNFNAPISKFPGKKVMINNAIEELRGNLFNVSGDITKFVNAAVEGDLELRAEASKYKGDWSKIISGLNDVMGAISMPINEALDVMDNLSKGDFSKIIQGDYKGSFGMIKSNLDLTVKNISGYIKEISGVLTEISRDNLDVYIEHEYVGDFASIKDAINGIADKLNKVISEINVAAEQVASGARQISESSMSLAQGASEQASAVEQLNATITSVNEQTRKNAENSEQADKLSTESKDNAAEGNIEMENMLESISGIKEAAQNISKVIKVIEDIALQTNLLALNAAVEAARAGQYGKGFAVVAEEVGNLAAKSQKSAVETTALIEDTINKVEVGTKIAAKTSEALTKIVTAVTGVSGIITEINVSSNEQKVAIDQILEGTEQISSVVQQNSGTSEESASAAQQLSGQAELLHNMIAAFKLRSGDKPKGSTVAPKPRDTVSNEHHTEPRPEQKEKQSKSAEIKHEIKAKEPEPSVPEKKIAPVSSPEPKRVTPVSSQKPSVQEPKKITPVSSKPSVPEVKTVPPVSNPQQKKELTPVKVQPKPEVKPIPAPEIKNKKEEFTPPKQAAKQEKPEAKKEFVSAKPIIGSTNAAQSNGVVAVKSGEAVYGARDFGKY